MTTINNVPELKASQFKPAQNFIHDWKLSQWRMTIYLDALQKLPSRGIMPTDQSIADFIGGKRTAHAVSAGINSLVNAGLVVVTGETALGSAYELTRRGELAVTQFNQVVTQWEEAHWDNKPIAEPNYQNSFHRLNSQLKAQRQTIESQHQTIGYQADIIRQLKLEVQQLRSMNINN